MSEAGGEGSFLLGAGMPARNERRAPSFNGTGAFLPQFFRDFEVAANRAGLDTDRWLLKVLDYARVEDYDLWKQVSEQPRMTWEDFKKQIGKFYAGADDERKYTLIDLEQLCETTSAKSSMTRSDFSDLYRKFYTIVTYLKSKDRLSDREASRQLLLALNLDLRRRVRAQLRAMEPTHYPDDPWTIQQIVDAANIVLATSAAETDFMAARVPTSQPLPMPAPLPPPMPAPRTTMDATALVDPERFNKMNDSFATAIASFTNMVESFNNNTGNWSRNQNQQSKQPQQTYQSNQQFQRSNRGGESGGGKQRQWSDDCAWCSDDGHYKKDCPLLADYVRRGLCRFDDAGMILLPNGDRVGRNTAPGRNLSQRVDNWYKTQRRTNTPNADTSQTVSSNLVGIVDSHDIADMPESLETMMPAPVLVTSAKLEEVTGEDEWGYTNPDDLPLLEAAHAQMTMKIEAARKEAKRRGPVTRSAAKNRENDEQRAGKQQDVISAPSTPKLNVHGATAKTAPILPRADTSTITQTGGKASVDNGPQFRFQSAIEDPQAAAKILERSLSSPVSLSVRELLGVSADVRKAVKDLVTSKKVPTTGGTDAASYLDEIVNEDEVVSSFLAALPPAPSGIIVANHTESLRTIEVNLEDRLKVHAILDEGSQIIGLRRELWERLHIPVRSDHVMTMEAANSSKNRTTGLLPNLKVSVGQCNFYLQVQVIDSASYDMLLGRPFHTLAQALIKHFRNGDALITLTDPNTDAVITVPTKSRARSDEHGAAKVNFLAL
ncbi:hypothetical protein MD484_g7577, partial [Candolleomyces efflorescens]